MKVKGEKKGRGMKKGRRMKQMIIAVMILVAFVAPASAATTLTITPDSATVGDVITISGTGFTTSGETVTLSTTATCYKPIVGGKCECCMEDFIIPANEDVSFRLSVSPVKGNVTIHVKKYLIWWTIDHDWLGFHFTYNPVTHTSNVSRAGVIDGTYNIDVIGDAEGDAENCTMIITITKKLTAYGTFSEDFDTQGIPICNFTVNATGETSGSSEDTLELFLEGDASKDGQINSYDCACIGRYSMGVPGYDDTTVCKSAADLDDDGAVELEDARHLASYLAGLETKEEAGLDK